MDDRDRALRVMDQPETDRPQQSALKRPPPRHPTTIIWARLDNSTSVGTTDDMITSLLTSRAPLPPVLSSAIAIASAMSLVACSACH